MSALNPSVTNEQVIPEVTTSLFVDRPDARFAVGIIAVNDIATEGFEDVHDAYYELRRRVYVDQTGQLSPNDIGHDGTDRDRDDSRSVAFGVVENSGKYQRLVGAVRLIVKEAVDIPSEVDGEALP